MVQGMLAKRADRVNCVTKNPKPKLQSSAVIKRSNMTRYTEREYQEYQYFDNIGRAITAPHCIFTGSIEFDTMIDTVFLAFKTGA